MFRNIEGKSDKAITAEWDALAPIRFEQIASGEDITYRNILVPNILRLASAPPDSSVVDAGCGVGFLTAALAKQFGTVVGIDPSSESIKLARNQNGDRASYIADTLESYARDNKSSADIVVANMVLMDVLELDNFLKAVCSVLKLNGTFIFSITHPCFWPRYYGYEHEPWFHYHEEIIVEGPFKISSKPPTLHFSTHVHRSLEAYTVAFTDAGLSLKKLLEPIPSKNIEVLYPEPWAYPRYLMGNCQRIS